LTLILNAVFVKSKEHTSILSKFTHILPKFLQILPGLEGILSRFLQNEKVWGCVCAPASYTSALAKRTIIRKELPAKSNIFALNKTENAYRLFSCDY